MIPVEALAVKVYAAIFQGATLPEGFTSKHMSGGLKAAAGKGLTIIEQNPNTNSSYAKLAKAGHKIAWVIKDIPGQFRGQYLGAIVDGQPEAKLKAVTI